jgi:hypothetical protein
MAIEKVRDFFGIRYGIFYDRCTLKPTGLFRVIGSVEFGRSVATVPLTGGHIDAAWDVETGQPENTLSMTLREYPFPAFKIFEDADTTETAAEALGNVGTIVNNGGTSVFDATTGIASVTAKAGEEANIKGVRYVFEATGANTVDIYVHGDDVFENIQGLSVLGVVVPSTGGTVDVDELGITITGGSGTVGFTTGDTASVLTRPIHNGFGITVVGNSDATVQNTGAIFVFPKKADGAQFWIDVPSMVGKGMPWNGTSREWSEYTVEATPLYDSKTDSVYTVYSKLPDEDC